MKKKVLTFVLCCLFCCLTCVLSGKENIYAAQILKPSVLSTGSEADISNARQKATYKFTTDGSDIYKLEVTHSGALEWDLFALKPGQINVNIYKKADASDLPTYAAFPCTVDRGNTFVLRQYIKKGTYYLKFPQMQNSYILTLVLYSSDGGTITSGTTAAAYCDAGM